MRVIVTHTDGTVLIHSLQFIRYRRKRARFSMYIQDCWETRSSMMLKRKSAYVAIEPQ